MEVAASLYKEGYKRVTMVVGSDRVVEFRTILEKYNGKKARHGFYNFERMNVVSAGARDPDCSRSYWYVCDLSYVNLQEQTILEHSHKAYQERFLIKIQKLYSIVFVKA